MFNTKLETTVGKEMGLRFKRNGNMIEVWSSDNNGKTWNMIDSWKRIKSN